MHIQKPCKPNLINPYYFLRHSWMLSTNKTLYAYLDLFFKCQATCLPHDITCATCSNLFDSTISPYIYMNLVLYLIYLCTFVGHNLACRNTNYVSVLGVTYKPNLAGCSLT